MGPKPYAEKLAAYRDAMVRERAEREAKLAAQAEAARSKKEKLRKERKERRRILAQARAQRRRRNAVYSIYLAEIVSFEKYNLTGTRASLGRRILPKRACD